MPEQPSTPDTLEIDRLQKRIRELEAQLQGTAIDDTAFGGNRTSVTQKDPLQRKPASKIALDDQNLLHSLLENIDDGVIVSNIQGEMILFNAAARRLIGIGPVEGSQDWAPQYGVYLADGTTLYASEDLPLSRALRGETIRNEHVFVTNADTPKGVDLSVSASPIRDHKDNLIGAIIIFHDLTSTKQHKADIESRDHALDSARREIEAQQNLFEIVLTTISIGITVSNAEGKFVLFNPAARRLLGVGPVSGVTNWTPEYGCFRMDGRPYPAEELPLARALRGEMVHEDKLYIYNPEKKRNVLLSVTAAPFINPPGDFEGALCFFYDITDTAEAQEKVTVSEDRFRAFMNNLPAVAFIKDASGRYIYGNHEFFKYHQTSPDQLLNGNITDYDLTSKTSAEQIRANDDRVTTGSTPVHVSEIISNTEGISTWFDVYKFQLTGLAQEALLGGIAVDVTERRKNAERLKADERLLRQMIVLQEKERLLVAHDIHDGFVQDVVGAKMLVESLAENLRPQDHSSSDAETDPLAAITSALGNAVADARRLISHLRPLVIDEEGVVEAIRYLISEQRYAEPLKITFIPEITQQRLDPLLEGNIYRIVQEALNNIEQHSEAGIVSISLKITDAEIFLSITDDGCGFDPSAATADHFGLRGMRERARLFGGHLLIDSQPGRGTRVEVKLPVNQPDT